MKRTVLFTMTAFGLVATGQAQWAVYDAANHSQQIIGTAQEIAKFVEMINNQVQQTQTLTDQPLSIQKGTQFSYFGQRILGHYGSGPGHVDQLVSLIRHHRLDLGRCCGGGAHRAVGAATHLDTIAGSGSCLDARGAGWHQPR